MNQINQVNEVDVPVDPIPSQAPPAQGPERAPEPDGNLPAPGETPSPPVADLRVKQCGTCKTSHPGSCSFCPECGSSLSTPTQGVGFTLTEISDQHQGRAHALTEGENLIGTSLESIVVLEDEWASRRHALLTVEGDKLKIEDVGATNGLYLRIASHELQPGDVLLIGKTLLRVSHSEE